VPPRSQIWPGVPVRVIAFSRLMGLVMVPAPELDPAGDTKNPVVGLGQVQPPGGGGGTGTTGATAKR